MIRIMLRMIAQELGLLLGILLIGGALMLASCSTTQLSEAARTACAGQAAANEAEKAALALGDVKAAEVAAATSAYLGLLCKW